MKNNKIKNIVAVLIAATMITSSLSSCKAFDFFGSSSDSTIDSSVESTDVNEVESENIDESSEDTEDTESVSQIEIDPWTDDNAITTTQTQQSTNEETTTKQTTTTTTKSFFDIFTPKTTTTTRKATTTSKKTTTTTSNRTQTSTTNSTRSTTTTTTTKSTTTTTKATQAQKTDYSISESAELIFSSRNSNSFLNKWYNSDLTAQGSLFGATYVLISNSYGGMGLKCSNSAYSGKINVTSNNASVSVVEVQNNSDHTGIILKANNTGKATITASIPNNTKTFSFTVAVVTEDQVIKKYQKEAMRLINEYRSNAGVDPLQADNGMKQTAELRAKECMQKFQSAMAAGQTNFTAEFAHSRPDGRTYATAFPDKYLHGGWLVNENVAVGYEVPVSMCRGWYNSSGHRTTMLSTHYDRGYVGLSIADNGRFYWTLEVAGLSNATVEGGEVSDEDKAIEPVRD